MAAMPRLAPEDTDHLLRSSSIVKEITYKADKIAYKIFDKQSNDLLRLKVKPAQVKVNNFSLKEILKKQGHGWYWQPLAKGGTLKISQSKGNYIEIYE